MTTASDPGGGSPMPEDTELLYAIFIQLSRIYDVLMLGLDSDTRAGIEKEHTNGQLLGPEPYINMTD